MTMNKSIGKKQPRRKLTLINRKNYVYENEKNRNKETKVCMYINEDVTSVSENENDMNRSIRKEDDIINYLSFLNKYKKVEDGTEQNVPFLNQDMKLNVDMEEKSTKNQNEIVQPTSDFIKGIANFILEDFYVFNIVDIFDAERKYYESKEQDSYLKSDEYDENFEENGALSTVCKKPEAFASDSSLESVIIARSPETQQLVDDSNFGILNLKYTEPIQKEEEMDTRNSTREEILIKYGSLESFWKNKFECEISESNYYKHLSENKNEKDSDNLEIQSEIVCSKCLPEFNPVSVDNFPSTHTLVFEKTSASNNDQTNSILFPDTYHEQVSDENLLLKHSKDDSLLQSTSSENDSSLEDNISTLKLSHLQNDFNTYLPLIYDLTKICHFETNFSEIMKPSQKSPEINIKSPVENLDENEFQVDILIEPSFTYDINSLNEAETKYYEMLSYETNNNQVNIIPISEPTQCDKSVNTDVDKDIPVSCSTTFSNVLSNDISRIHSFTQSFNRENIEHIDEQEKQIAENSSSSINVKTLKSDADHYMPLVELGEHNIITEPTPLGEFSSLGSIYENSLTSDKNFDRLSLSEGSENDKCTQCTVNNKNSEALKMFENDDLFARNAVYDSFWPDMWQYSDAEKRYNELKSLENKKVSSASLFTFTDHDDDNDDEDDLSRRDALNRPYFSSSKEANERQSFSQNSLINNSIPFSSNWSDESTYLPLNPVYQNPVDSIPINSFSNTVNINTAVTKIAKPSTNTVHSLASLHHSSLLKELKVNVSELQAADMYNDQESKADLVKENVSERYEKAETGFDFSIAASIQSQIQGLEQRIRVLIDCGIAEQVSILQTLLLEINNLEHELNTLVEKGCNLNSDPEVLNMTSTVSGMKLKLQSLKEFALSKHKEIMGQLDYDNNMYLKYQSTIFLENSLIENSNNGTYARSNEEEKEKLHLIEYQCLLQDLECWVIDTYTHMNSENFFSSKAAARDSLIANQEILGDEVDTSQSETMEEANMVLMNLDDDPNNRTIRTIKRKKLIRKIVYIDGEPIETEEVIEDPDEVTEVVGESQSQFADDTEKILSHLNQHVDEDNTLSTTIKRIIRKRIIKKIVYIDGEPVETEEIIEEPEEILDETNLNSSSTSATLGQNQDGTLQDSDKVSKESSITYEGLQNSELTSTTTTTTTVRRIIRRKKIRTITYIDGYPTETEEIIEEPEEISEIHQTTEPLELSVDNNLISEDPLLKKIDTHPMSELGAEACEVAKPIKSIQIHNIPVEMLHETTETDGVPKSENVWLLGSRASSEDVYKDKANLSDGVNKDNTNLNLENKNSDFSHYILKPDLSESEFIPQSTTILDESSVLASSIKDNQNQKGIETVSFHEQKKPEIVTTVTRVIRKRVIKKIVYIDGQPIETEEIIEEPVEVFENVNIKESLSNISIRLI
ncbi:hypothetical protein Avbf_03383 [Armadillidium vulgare]|nr:hypothetical protein Avbf_03383 [Armadillidium vulgare]